MHSRLLYYGPGSPHGELPSRVYRSGVLGLITILAPPGDGHVLHRAAEGERCSGYNIGRRDPTAEARGPRQLDRGLYFPHPVQMSQRGLRAAEPLYAVR